MKSLNKFLHFVAYFVLYPINNLKLNLFKPKQIESKKYKVSICAIFKNEAPYLKEWIEYHKIVGIDHFYLNNNNSTDNYLEILQPYIEDNTVTLIQFPELHAQMKCYEQTVEKYKHESEWITFIDIDEFIVPNSTDNIYNFLKPFQKNRGSVVMFWKTYGSSGLIDRDIKNPVITDFIKCAKHYTSIGKVFYNTAYDINYSYKNNNMFHHKLYTSLNNKILPPVNIFNKLFLYGINSIPLEYKNNTYPIQLNHYALKSFNEYQDRKKQGDVFYDIKEKTDRFTITDKNCIYTDNAINKYIPQLMEKLK